MILYSSFHHENVKLTFELHVPAPHSPEYTPPPLLDLQILAQVLYLTYKPPPLGYQNYIAN